jgi:hypothetical protein
VTRPVAVPIVVTGGIVAVTCITLKCTMNKIETQKMKNHFKEFLKSKHSGLHLLRLIMIKIHFTIKRNQLFMFEISAFVALHQV